MARPQIQFPVLRKFAVKDYALFPGESRDPGISKTILPGVTVVLGINGIGKTTLLNIVQRALLGPFEPRKADVQRPGSKTHELVNIKRFTYFSDRVGGDASEARATLTFAFGSAEVTITRNLGNLNIEQLQHNGQDVEDPDEEQYEQLILKLSGTNSRYDLDFIIRHLVFFLEEKIPLIWNPQGQFEILRILFLDEKLSSQCAELHDSILVLDSQYRNFDWQLGKREEEVAAIMGQQSQLGTLAEEIPILQRQFSEADQKYTDLKSAADRLEREVEQGEERLFQLQMRLHEISEGLRQNQETYFRALFPKLPDAVQVTIGTLLTDSRCLVCGSPTRQARARIQKLLHSNSCPVCETPVQESTNVRHFGKADLHKIKGLEEQLMAVRGEIEKSAKHLQTARVEFDETKQAERESFRERARLEVRLRDAEAKNQPYDTALATLQAAVKTNRKELSEMRNRLAVLRSRYSKQLEKARTQIEAAANDIVRTFRVYAGEFLADECVLTYEMHKRTIGQSGGVLLFPNFSVELASGVSSVRSVREEVNEVSESQKEFIDLAFRMALMQAAAKRGAHGMLVIETPEASLDALFVERAGRMLRQFAFNKRKKPSNVVIASTNLNSERMVKWLLGIGEPAPLGTKDKDLDDYVINLLNLAAKSKVAREQAQFYRRVYRQALGRA
jgi:DNA repair exonuclease SbcCD ATPase subunit